MPATMRSALLWAALACLAAADDDPASPEACAIAATLFGTVFVIMVLYYLFNWPDPDIRRYTYEIISSTISIFSAVLLFQSFAGTLEALMDGQPLWATITAAFVHRLFWHAVLQILLAYFTKSICHTEETKRQILEGGEEGGPDEDKMNTIELNAKCWGLILAHMTGFASIACWGSVQQSPWFKQNWYISWLVVPACLITNVPFLWFTNWMRTKIAKADGEADELENMWDEEVEEAENDITALGLSFLTVQSVKFLFCGVLADVEGEESAYLTFNHKALDYIYLFSFGTLCIPVFCYFVLRKNALEEGEEREKEERKNSHHTMTDEEREQVEEASEKNERCARNMDQIVATFTMNLAWSYFYATKWALGSFGDLWGENTTLLCLTEALVASVVGFSFIFVLDACSDASWTGPSADKCISAVVQAIGIVVGFSWEQSFDASVAALGSSSPHPVCTKQLLAIACALLVVPAWKIYMLPIIVHEGWRFGFIASHATQYIDEDDEDSMKHYFAQLQHLVSGHKVHIGNPELKKNITDLLKAQIATLDKEDDEENEDKGYHMMEDKKD